jgi:ubiquinone/menaquinone biosynthesis C-methylase UbiE
VIREARIDSSSRVLELGSGTGNLSCLIDQCGELVCVDLSEQMEAIARSKLGHIPNRRFIKTGFPIGEILPLVQNLTLCTSFRILAF